MKAAASASAAAKSGAEASVSASPVSTDSASPVSDSLPSLISAVSPVSAEASLSVISLPSLSAAGASSMSVSAGANDAVIGSTIAAATPARSGGSGIRSAIPAMRVGSCSVLRRSKNAAISCSKAATVAPTCWTRDSTTRPC